MDCAPRERFSDPKTTRQWPVSPNHQTNGVDSRALARQHRQTLSVGRASLIGERTAQPPIHPMDRVAQFAGRLTAPVQSASAR